MKKIAFAVAVALVASSAMALGARHDFSAGTVDACKFCHIPHGANTTMSGAPLWNRDTNTANYNFKNTTLRGTTVGAPGDRSLTCLSCHDGSTQMSDLYGSATLAANYNAISNTNVNYIGSDLTNDHPVGVAYGGTNKGLNATPSVTVIATALGTGNVECATCHEPHDTTNGFFLRSTNAGGALCLACHVK